MTTTEPAPATPIFEHGVDPRTGDVALRLQAYEALRTFAGTAMTINEVATLIDDDPGRVRQALCQLLDVPSRYPHVHRPARGVYLFDDRRPATKTFRKKARRVGRKTEPQPAPEVRRTPSDSSLVEADRPRLTVLDVPVFNDGAVDPDAVLLRDDEGAFWIARRA